MIYLSQDGHVSSSQAEARTHGSFQSFETPSTKSDWIDFINLYYAQGAPTAQSAPPVNVDTARQADFNITAEEQIQNGSFDDAVRLFEQCTGRIREHIRAAKRGES